MDLLYVYTTRGVAFSKFCLGGIHSKSTTGSTPSAIEHAATENVKDIIIISFTSYRHCPACTQTDTFGYMEALNSQRFILQ